MSQEPCDNFELALPQGVYTYFEDLVSRLAEAQHLKIELYRTDDVAADGSGRYSKRLFPTPRTSLSLYQGGSRQCDVQDSMTISHFASQDTGIAPPASISFRWGSKDEPITLSEALGRTHLTDPLHEMFHSNIIYTLDQGDYATEGGRRYTWNWCWSKTLQNLWLEATQKDNGNSFLLNASIDIEVQMKVKLTRERLQELRLHQEHRSRMTTDLPTWLSNADTESGPSGPSSASQADTMYSSSP